MPLLGMRWIVRLLTIAAAVGCGSRTELDAVSVADASADVSAEAPPVCPNGPAPTPLLVAHTGLDAAYVESAPRTGAGGDLVASIRLNDGSAFRIVAISACGDVREIAAEHEGPPPRFVVVEGDELFAANAAGVWRVPLSGGALTLVTSESGPIAVDHANVYIAEGDHVARVPRPSGAPQLFVSETAEDIALDDTYVYLNRADAILRVAKNDPSQVVTLAPPDFSGVVWWDERQLALDETRVFYVHPQSGGDDIVCAVPKSGGASSCSAPMPEARGLLWSGALFYLAKGAIDELPNVDTPPITLAKPNLATMWVDDASVWWLTIDGDLYRVDK